MAELQKTVIVSGKTVADFGAVAVAIATAASQFLREEKSYEVLFLAFAFLCLYGFVKFLMNRVEELKDILDRVTREYDAKLTRLSDDYNRNITDMRNKHDAYVQTSNTTIANLFSDVSAYAGSRKIGELSIDKTSGAMVYTKNITHGPEGIERRGTNISNLGTPQ